jgi:hypothetical protein
VHILLRELRTTEKTSRAPGKLSGA